MKNILLALLERVTPSKVIINNCVELIQREQIGIQKYGVTLTDAKLSHEQVLQHLLEEQLDAANYTRKAIMTIKASDTDYALLRKAVDEALAKMAQLGATSEDDSYDDGIEDARDVLKEVLFKFDSAKVLRDLSS